MLQLLLDTIPTRVFWKDRDSLYLGCNRLFAADAGYCSPRDIVGKTDFDMPWKEQADIYRADDRTVMRTATAKLGYEESQTISDGRTVHMRKNKVPLRDEEGRIIGVMGTYEDFTDRKTAEEQLRERESLYRTIFDHSPFSVALNSLSGEFVDVNEKFTEILGVAREEAIGRTPAELGIIEGAAQTTILDVIGRTEGSLDGYEILLRTRGGETKYGLLSTALVKLKDETLVLSMLNDVTQRKQAEESLRRSEEKYRELVQNANSIIFRWGRDGTIHFFNEFAQTFFGYTEEEIVGRSVLGTILPETETSGRDLQEMIGEIAAHPTYHGTNVNENMRKSGERIWVAWTNKPVFEQGGITEILSVGLDITARIHDQQALQESEARYRALFDSTQDAVFVMRGEQFIDCNNAALEMFGCYMEDLVGQTPLRFSPSIQPDGQSSVEKATEKIDAVCGGVPQRFEWRHSRLDGTAFDVEVSLDRLSSDDTPMLLAIVRDVTERKDAERRERELDLHKRDFYRKTIEAATEGKLIVCDLEEIEQATGPPIATYEIKRAEEAGVIREAITQIAESEGMDDSRVFDLVLCLGEAATNAIKHADGGKVSVHRRDGALLVLVVDDGPGMQAINLPDVALKRGYTTAMSLGMGYKAMISVADQVYLATGPAGTTVAVEMALQAAEKPVGEIALPDTW